MLTERIVHEEEDFETVCTLLTTTSRQSTRFVKGPRKSRRMQELTRKQERQRAHDVYAPDANPHVPTSD